MDKIKEILNRLDRPDPPSHMQQRILQSIAGEIRPKQSRQYANYGIACLIASVLFFFCFQGPVLPAFNTATETLRERQEQFSSSLREIMQSANDFLFSEPGGN